MESENISLERLRESESAAVIHRFARVKNSDEYEVVWRGSAFDVEHVGTKGRFRIYRPQRSWFRKWRMTGVAMQLSQDTIRDFEVRRREARLRIYAWDLIKIVIAYESPDLTLWQKLYLCLKTRRIPILLK